MIGDDVVDLRDPETRAGATHPRFDERVMAPSERRWLATRDRPERDRWLLWAAKEAAYKAARRMDPMLVFAPSRFVAALEEDGGGCVTIGDDRFDVEVRVVDDAVHAVARLAGAPPAAIVAGSSRGAGADPSAGVRRLALTAVAARVAGALDVVLRGRVPELRGPGDRGSPLSLSHHGDVVGFAAALPEAAR